GGRVGSNEQRDPALHRHRRRTRRRSGGQRTAITPPSTVTHTGAVRAHVGTPPAAGSSSCTANDGTCAVAAATLLCTVVVSAALDGASNRTSPTPSPTRGSAQLTTDRGWLSGMRMTAHAVCSSTRPTKLL